MDGMREVPRDFFILKVGVGDEKFVHSRIEHPGPQLKIVVGSDHTFLLLFGSFLGSSPFVSLAGHTSGVNLKMPDLGKVYLGCGNSNKCFWNFHPEPWGNDPI